MNACRLIRQFVPARARPPRPPHRPRVGPLDPRQRVRSLSRRLIEEEVPGHAGERVAAGKVVLEEADQPREKRQISVRTRLNTAGQMELAVIDSGNGIAPEKLPRLFEPFYTTKPHGMGMGLCIARTIIEAHHGRIWAENSAAGGAVFRISLPVSDERHEARGR
mgnify:CR=1 FL=1